MQSNKQKVSLILDILMKVSYINEYMCNCFVNKAAHKYCKIYVVLLYRGTIRFLNTRQFILIKKENVTPQYY